ncbi:hypothetical protein HPB50_023815 [Hyalomma asiaticum]|uniref:Uncharacterized protein n=1 Tax=Hyalomma asiaticum TaxID=266040 RepID=A0ACB7SSU2_HYAAI|nr:hypothetical protein HPB50_023815 [Hyalomma asiaticum]
MEQNLDWDETFPSAMCTVWLKSSSEVAMLDDLHIPEFRAVGAEGPCQQVDIHNISDANESAYGSAAYLRTVHATGTFTAIRLTETWSTCDYGSKYYAT